MNNPSSENHADDVKNVNDNTASPKSTNNPEEIYLTTFNINPAVDPDKHPVTNRQDHRYKKAERQIHEAIDKMIASGEVKTQVMDFSALAGINSCTFYRHYTSVPHAMSCRDKAFYRDLQECTKPRNLSVVFYRIFKYLQDNQLYFHNAKSRLNTELIKNFARNDLRPLVYEHWSRQTGKPLAAASEPLLQKIYRAHCYELLREYDEWANFENFDDAAVDGHVRRMLYLTNTARSRLNREFASA